MAPVGGSLVSENLSLPAMASVSATAALILVVLACMCCKKKKSKTGRDAHERSTGGQEVPVAVLDRSRSGVEGSPSQKTLSTSKSQSQSQKVQTTSSKPAFDGASFLNSRAANFSKRDAETKKMEEDDDEHLKTFPPDDECSKSLQPWEMPSIGKKPVEKTPSMKKPSEKKGSEKKRSEKKLSEKKSLFSPMSKATKAPPPKVKPAKKNANLEDLRAGLFLKKEAVRIGEEPRSTIGATPLKSGKLKSQDNFIPNMLSKPSPHRRSSLKNEKIISLRDSDFTPRKPPSQTKSPHSLDPPVSTYPSTSIWSRASEKDPFSHKSAESIKTGRSVTSRAASQRSEISTGMLKSVTAKA